MEVAAKKKRGRPCLGKVIKDDLEKWRTYPGLQIPKDESRFRRFAKKLNKYELNNQFRNGAFFCKLGKPINEERVLRYEGMCHKVVRQFLPALMLWEAGYVYEDLINMCRREIFLALLDGFDPVKAMTSTHKDPVRRLEIEAYKKENPAETFDKSEKSIVYGRLRDFIRRERWKYHPSQRGGYSISRDALLTPRAVRTEAHRTPCVEYEYGMYSIQDTNDCLLTPEFIKQRDDFLTLLEKEGEGAVKNCFAKLSEKEKEFLVEYLKDSVHAEWTTIAHFSGENLCKSE